MSLFDSVVGGLLGGQAQQSPQSSPLGGVLSSLLGNAGAQPGGAQPGGAAPGIMGLVSRFEQAGLGNVAQSWVGNGPNQSVTPQQLHQVLGDTQVNQLAQQSNMPPHDLLSQLAQVLPQLVDRMTPQGQIPAQGGTGADGIADGMKGVDPFAAPGVETT